MRWYWVLFAAGACVADPLMAHAQAFEVRDRFQTDGVVLPPTGVALADEGTAAVINPGGVGLLKKPQLFYLHERNLRANRLVDSLFLGTGLFGLGGATLGLQWVRPHGMPAYRKTTWTLAAGGDLFSLGASYNIFSSSDDAGLDKLNSWDAGLMFRPLRHLSFGASVRDFDGPRLNGVQLPVRYDVGLALRPLTDRVALAGDFLIDSQTGLPGSRLSFAALFEPLDGLVISGGLATGLHQGDVVGQVALTLNAVHAGAAWSGGGGSDLGNAWDQLVQLRVSADRYRPLPIARDRFLVLDVPQLLSRPSGTLVSLLAPSGREPYLELLGILDRVREDRTIAGVLVKVSGLPEVGHGRVEELRQALLDLRRKGKRVYALFVDGGDDEYLLATAAERIWTVPQATFLVNGYTATATFLAGTLSKIGVTVNVARVGAYKSAPDMYTRTDMSVEERETLDAWLDGLYRRSVTTVEKSRHLSQEKVTTVINQGILSARAAKEAGLIDEIAYPDELQRLFERSHGRELELVGETPKSFDVPRRWGTRPKISVINVEGLLTEGKSRSDPFGLTRIAGAETVLRALETAMDDPLSKAIVLRIDSPGGSGPASDLVWRAVEKVRERKPVVVSMGDTAASGGYYIAVAAERIYAEPSTLTGSIGVFALKPSFGGLLEKVGVTQEILHRGERADILSLSRPWSPGEQQAMQQWVDEFYEEFISRVAKARKMTKAQVDAVGRGRVFSGEAALAAGLVDELGGLSDAVDWAKRRAGLAGDDVDLELVKDGSSVFDMSLAAESQDMVRIGRLLGDAAYAVGVALEVPSGPLALLPYKVSAK